MGDKRPTIRTLKSSGEKVTHYPDGTQVMIPADPLAESLKDTESVLRSSERKKAEARQEAVEAKRDSLASGNSVPSDKRVV